MHREGRLFYANLRRGSLYISFSFLAHLHVNDLGDHTNISANHDNSFTSVIADDESTRVQSKVNSSCILPWLGVAHLAKDKNTSVVKDSISIQVFLTIAISAAGPVTSAIPTPI